ncbi:excalibur calcium-binding domain-containing protein [Nocardioides sp.]|nr:DUF1524 domain-containing protein [Nocardioides sp.]
MQPSMLKLLTRRLVTAAAATLVAAPLLASAPTGMTAPGAADATSEGAVVTSPIATASAAAQVQVRLRAAIRNLPVAAETPAGYARSKFRHWIDADGDCQDTRDEVLKAESRVAVSGCDIRRGKWFSYYDRRTWTLATDVDIDHVVALKEAWDSGAKRWNADTRKRFANDLGDKRSLVAVTDNVNQSKSDRDPAEWLPRYSKCRYVAEWTAVKIRWSLKVNRAEKAKLAKVASGCRNVVLTVRKAAIRTGTSGGGTGGGGGGGTDPRYGTCTEAKSHGYGPYYQGQDEEYYWYDDRDNDGVVCE